MLEILLRMLIACVLTVIIECGFAALLFRIRDKYSLAVVALVQVLTNPVVNGFCGLIIPAILIMNGMAGTTAYEIIVDMSVAVFEIAAVVVEGFVYKKFEFPRPFIMSMTLNVLSFVSGLVLSAFLVLL